MNALHLMLGFALLLVAMASVTDLRTGHIPNRLTLGGLVAGALLQVIARILHEQTVRGLSPASFAVAVGSAALGLLVCSLVPYFLFLRRAMGGGDVKLLAALGAALGPVIGLEAELYAFVAMAVFALAQLAYEGRLFAVLGNSATLMINPLCKKERQRQLAPELLTSLKFAPAVLVGTLLTALLHWSAS